MRRRLAATVAVSLLFLGAGTAATWQVIHSAVAVGASARAAVADGTEPVPLDPPPPPPPPSSGGGLGGGGGGAF